jgi:hypothetical protein
MIENPTPTRRALLTWQRPLDENGRRDRCAVAELCQGEDGVSFRYFDDNELTAAREAGFSGYPGLPIESDEIDRIGCDVLMRRLPPRERADFSDIIERFGLPADHEYSDLSLLAYTGARMTSDSFAICETFDGFDLPFTYVFDVAGNRHYQELYTQLVGSETLLFQREPTNQWDPDAILITRLDGTHVGYVNRLQADMVGGWLDNGVISASVFRVNGRAQYPRLFVRAEVSAAVDIKAA